MFILSRRQGWVLCVWDRAVPLCWWGRTLAVPSCWWRSICPGKASAGLTSETLMVSQVEAECSQSTFFSQFCLRILCSVLVVVPKRDPLDGHFLPCSVRPPPLCVAFQWPCFPYYLVISASVSCEHLSSLGHVVEFVACHVHGVLFSRSLTIIN